ncbi:MAG TPA: hypothetical protein VFV43_01055 [Limnobacter sp.]|nr:hypothetical protein [Limnobacter sp.]
MRTQQYALGVALLELALALAIGAMVLISVQRALFAQQAQQSDARNKSELQKITSHLEGFVLARGRLPCPATQANGAESRLSNGQCSQYAGWLPNASLGLPTSHHAWRMVTASLSSAGAPAAHSLTTDHPLSLLSLPQLGEVVYAPITAGQSIGDGPLPALHLCLHNGLEPLPPAHETGCGGLATHSISAVLVLIAPHDTINQARTAQFFINPNLPQNNPAWLSFERLSWLWLQRGSLHTLSGTTP